MVGEGAGVGSRLVGGIVEGIGTRDAGMGLDAGLSRGGGVAGTVGRIVGAGSVVGEGDEAGAGASDGLRTEDWRRARGTASMGGECERVTGRWRDERRSTGRGEGICPVTIAMASEGEASGSSITALGGGR